MKHLSFLVFTLLLVTNVVFGQSHIDVVDSIVKMKTSFPVLGFTMGTPAIVHIVGGYYFDGFGVRASAGYIPEMYAMQINILRNISRSKKFSHNISLTAGFHYDNSRVEYVTWAPGSDYSQPSKIRTSLFAGLAYDVNIAGMFFEGGIALANGTYPNPMFTFQVGYVHEFK